MRRQIIVEEDLVEAEVHPHGTYARLVEAFAESASLLQQAADEFVDVDCPACASPERSEAFIKRGFSYHECRECGSLYASPRPNPEQMASYLSESAAAAYRSSADYRSALAQRTAELAGYRAGWLASLCSKTDGVPGPCVVYEPGGRELLDALCSYFGEDVVAVRPVLAAREVPEGERSWQVVSALTPELVKGARVVAVLDVLERQSTPDGLLEAGREVLAPGGFLAVTTRCGGGFDIQVAWEQATIIPPEHLNLPTVEGMEAMLDRLGFEVVELSTPGQLDVQMVERLAVEGGAKLPRWVRYVINRRDERAKRRLQQFLQENLLSSHLRLVARRPVEG